MRRAFCCGMRPSRWPFAEPKFRAETGFFPNTVLIKRGVAPHLFAHGAEARKEHRSTNRDRRSARHERTLTPTVDVPEPHRRLLPPSTPLPLRPPPLLGTCTALSKAVKSSCTMFATSIGRVLCQSQHIFGSVCKSCAISDQFCRTNGHPTVGRLPGPPDYVQGTGIQNGRHCITSPVYPHAHHRRDADFNKH